MNIELSQQETSDLYASLAEHCITLNLHISRNAHLRGDADARHYLHRLRTLRDRMGDALTAEQDGQGEPLDEQRRRLVG